MIIIKDKITIEKMKAAGQAIATLFSSLTAFIRPGISTLELDAWIEKELQAKGLVSQSKGYMGYEHASCISLNDEVVHGIPSAKRVLKEGDLVKIDICAALDGYCADMARTFIIGKTSHEISHFVDAAKLALDKGVEQAKTGKRLSDISAAIQQEVERQGFNIVRDFAGHGIGRSMHEEPEILNYGAPGQGPVLRPGMTFAIEPMITMGGYDIYIAEDGWTVRTVDKSLSAHVEDTVAVTTNGPIVLTRMN
jgi:methionyl aminopeptidase